MPAVIRLFRCVPAQPAFDDILRHEILPDLAAKPGIIDWYSGRQGPDDTGPRTVVSVWESRDAMVAAVGDRLGVFHPEHLAATTAQQLDVLDVLVQARDLRGGASILRTFTGTVAPGTLRRYADDVRSGVERDAAAGHGPTALYLAEAGGDMFVTVSAWLAWADVEAATGGNTRQPLATKASPHLLDWEVEHWELVGSAAGG